MLDRLGFDQRGARPHQARQSQAIRTWRPWTRSTGPRSDAGNKSRSANRRDDLAVTRDSGRCWLSADGACRRQSTSRAPVKHQGKQQGKQHHVSPGEGWCWRIKAHLPSSVRGHVLPERPFPVKIDGARGVQLLLVLRTPHPGAAARADPSSWHLRRRPTTATQARGFRGSPKARALGGRTRTFKHIKGIL